MLLTAAFLQMFIHVAHAEDILVPSASEDPYVYLYDSLAESLEKSTSNVRIVRSLRTCNANCADVDFAKGDATYTLQLNQKGRIYYATLRIETESSAENEINEWRLQGQTIEQLASKINATVRANASYSSSTESTSVLSTETIQEGNPVLSFDRGPKLKRAFDITAEQQYDDSSEVSNLSTLKRINGRIGRDETVLSKKNTVSLLYNQQRSWGQFNLEQGYVYDSMPLESFDAYVESEDGFPATWNTYYQEIYMAQNKSNQSLGLQYTRTINRFIDIGVAAEQMQNQSKIRRGVYDSNEEQQHFLINKDSSVSPYGVQTQIAAHPVSIAGFSPFVQIGSSSVYLPGVTAQTKSGLEFSIINPSYLHMITYGAGLQLNTNRIQFNVDYTNGIWVTELPARKTVINPDMEENETGIPFTQNNNDTPASLRASLGIRF